MLFSFLALAATAAATHSLSSTSSSRSYYDDDSSRSSSSSSYSYDDARLSSLKASYESSFWSRYGSTSLSDYSSSSSTLDTYECSRLASSDRSFCGRAVQTVHLQGLDSGNPITADYAECDCSSYSRQLKCFTSDTDSLSYFSSKWQASTCTALITGQGPGSASSAPTTGSSSYSAASVTSSTSGGAGASVVHHVSRAGHLPLLAAAGLFVGILAVLL